MIGRAFAPGHITGFFEIRDKHKDLRRCGSRGAGICLSKGVFSEAKCEEAAHQEIRVFWNRGSGIGIRDTLYNALCGIRDSGFGNRAISSEGKVASIEGIGNENRGPGFGIRESGLEEIDGAVVKQAVRNLVGAAPYRIEIREKIELPISQGFGMSAAGALSAAFAVASALGVKKSYWEIAAAAHLADIQCKGGLGDVVCAATGGIDIRRKEGLPPFGFIDRIPAAAETPVTVAVLGRELETNSVLDNAKKRRAVCDYGTKCMERITKEPTLWKMMELSREFTIETGLASPEVTETMALLQNAGIPASMSMLGNSIFAIGAKSEVNKILKCRYVKEICKYIEEMKIDFYGVRIL